MSDRSPTDVLATAEDLQRRLHTRRLARFAECHPVIDSTNRRAMDLARAGAPDGTLVLADHQTHGRGRLARRWHAPAGSSLLFSLLLRPPLKPQKAQQATMLCAVAAVEAIAEQTGLTAAIKWPNDILVADRKAGGILTELLQPPAASDAQDLAIVVGIGINVNVELADLAPDVWRTATTPPTSLAAEFGRPVPRLPLLLSLLHKADNLYDHLLESARASSAETRTARWSPLPQWRKHLATLGKQVSIATQEGTVEGTAIDVDNDGALLIQTRDGGVERILVGDVVRRDQALDRV
jgi:BirA family transcriptional regulator, biotin operon repressor / biotin---[acetyl-CoA-carboxylase] ligase